MYKENSYEERVRKNLRRIVPPLDSHAIIMKNIHQAFCCISSLQDWHEKYQDNIPGDTIMRLIDTIGKNLSNIVECQGRLIDRHWE